jgi:hypothetical protein
MMGCDVGISFIYYEWLWIAALFECPPGGGSKNAPIHNHSQYIKEIPTSHPIILTIVF